MSKFLYDTISLYTRKFPMQKGKGRLVDWLLNADLDKYECVTKSVDGRQFLFNSKTRHNYQIFFFGERERHETKIVTSLVKNDDTVFDVGANVGWYTTLISKIIGTNGKILAFEPVPQNFKHLSCALELNGCSDNVILFNNLCGEHEGVGTIYEFPNLHPGLCSEKPIEQQEKITHSIKIVVLDSIMQQQNIKHIDFLKIDVEGAELEVLAGLQKSLSCRMVDSIMIEVNEERSAAFGYKFQACFDLIYNSTPYDIFKVSTKTPTLTELQSQTDFETGDNLFFIRKNSKKSALIDNLLSLI